MKIKEITKKAVGLLASLSFIATPGLALAEGSSYSSGGGGIVVAPAVLLLLVALVYEHENRR